MCFILKDKNLSFIIPLDYRICSSRFDTRSLVPAVILMSLSRYNCPKWKKISVFLLFSLGVCVPTWVWSEQGMSSKKVARWLAQKDHTCQSHAALLRGAHKYGTYIWMFSLLWSCWSLGSVVRGWFWYCGCGSIICLVGRRRKTAWWHKGPFPSIIEIIPNKWGYLWEVLDSSN